MAIFNLSAKIACPKKMYLKILHQKGKIEKGKTFTLRIQREHMNVLWTELQFPLYGPILVENKQERFYCFIVNFEQVYADIVISLTPGVY